MGGFADAVGNAFNVLVMEICEYQDEFIAAKTTNGIIGADEMAEA
jgi:hypothetical protein